MCFFSCRLDPNQWYADLADLERRVPMKSVATRAKAFRQLAWEAVERKQDARVTSGNIARSQRFLERAVGAKVTQPQ